MRKLLNTLYVTSPNTYLSLDGENIVILKDEAEALRVPCIIWRALLPLAIPEPVRL